MQKIRPRKIPIMNVLATIAVMLNVVIFTTFSGVGVGALWLAVETGWGDSAIGTHNLIRQANNTGGEVGGSLKFAVINPGYTVDGKSNVGELIALRNVQGGSILLAGFSINYINSSGNSSLLLEFPAESEMTREVLQLRLASTGEPADLSYSKTIAMKGALELVYKGEVVDRVCWTGKDDCAAEFNSKKPMVMVRDFESMAWDAVNTADFALEYNPEEPAIKLNEGRGEVEENTAEAGDIAPTAHCAGLQFSELFSYYEETASEQFVEIYNTSDTEIVLDGCKLKYKSKNYALSGRVAAGKYHVYSPQGFTLTKNPTNQNELEIIDADGSVVDKLVYYNGQKKGMAMAQFGYDAAGEELWLATYLPTPGEENNYQKYKTCEEGKVINEETGNCVKASSVNTTLEACPEGKFRNPLTGRCKSYAKSSSTLTECAEGYERNPETNRCRKIKTNTGADYALAEESAEIETQVNFVALAGIVVVSALGTLYILWQFRREIGRGVLKLFKKIMQKEK